jgi:hypothetical protein
MNTDIRDKVYGYKGFFMWLCRWRHADTLWQSRILCMFCRPRKAGRRVGRGEGVLWDLIYCMHTWPGKSFLVQISYPCLECVSKWVSPYDFQTEHDIFPSPSETLELH